MRFIRRGLSDAAREAINKARARDPQKWADLKQEANNENHYERDDQGDPGDECDNER